MAKSQRDKLLVGLAGEHFVAAELCRRGFVASLTLKNYPKVDIFVLNPRTNKTIPVQVKATQETKNWAFFVPSDADAFPGAFVFVIVSDTGYQTYQLTGPQVDTLSRDARRAYVQLPRKKPIEEEDQPLMLGINELKDFQDHWQLIEELTVD